MTRCSTLSTSLEAAGWPSGDNWLPLSSGLGSCERRKSPLRFSSLLSLSETEERRRAILSVLNPPTDMRAFHPFGASSSSSPGPEVCSKERATVGSRQQRARTRWKSASVIRISSRTSGSRSLSRSRSGMVSLVSCLSRRMSITQSTRFSSSNAIDLLSAHDTSSRTICFASRATRSVTSSTEESSRMASLWSSKVARGDSIWWSPWIPSTILLKCLKILLRTILSFSVSGLASPRIWSNSIRSSGSASTSGSRAIARRPSHAWPSVARGSPNSSGASARRSALAITVGSTVIAHNASSFASRLSRTTETSAFWPVRSATAVHNSLRATISRTRNAVCSSTVMSSPRWPASWGSCSCVATFVLYQTVALTAAESSTTAATASVHASVTHSAETTTACG
mmetsp:Transcript_16568/g.33912  ORF Transcript_16568/g.33912 Transcript_16568/m.33912 type:complete len:398 (+) Transcript_16568:2345-3538(+)